LPEAADREELLSEASTVLENPALASIFAPETLAEVPITAQLGEQRLYGIIDRLIVTPERVLAVDFKSNAQVPESARHCPKGLLRQMAAYGHALTQIYPGRQIETALLWTRTASLMSLPHDLVTDALKEVLEP
jgi:ATP-dependent helicase/nuclease subunit A